jgi:hypothetical protein
MTTCTFKVTVFNICLVDDANPTARLFVNSFTGQYRFQCGGVRGIREDKQHAGVVSVRIEPHAARPKGESELVDVDDERECIITSACRSGAMYDPGS